MVKAFLLALHIHPQYRLQTGFGLPLSSSACPDSASLFSSSCLSPVPLYLCFIWALSVRSPVHSQLASCSLVLREESPGRWLAVMDLFVASQVILLTIPWASPSSVCCSESRVFSLLFSFLSFLKTRYDFTITASEAVGCLMCKQFFLIHEYQILLSPSSRSLFSASIRNCSQCMWEIPWIFHTLLQCCSRRCCVI